MKLFGAVGVAFFFPKRQGSCWVAEAASHLYSLVLSALVPVCSTGRVFFARDSWFLSLTGQSIEFRVFCPLLWRLQPRKV